MYWFSFKCSPYLRRSFTVNTTVFGVGFHIAVVAACRWAWFSKVVACVVTGKIKDHQLEKKLGDHARAVVIRRRLFEGRIGRSMENLPVQVCS